MKISLLKEKRVKCQDTRCGYEKSVKVKQDGSIGCGGYVWCPKCGSVMFPVIDKNKREKESEVKTKLEPYKEAEEDIELARKWKEFKDNKLSEERLKGVSIKKEVLMPLAPPTREEYVLCRCKECGYEYSIRQDRVNGKWKGVCQFCEKKQKEATPHDVVNNPSHYKRGEIECYEALKASMTKEQFLGHLKATAIAYLWRYDLKNGLEDVKKAKWYVDKMVKEMEGE